MAIRSEQLSAKVYWDTARPPDTLELAYKGLETMCETTDVIRILPERRKVHLASEDTLWIASSEVQGRRLEADLNIILTDRQIYIPPDENDIALGISPDLSAKVGVAVTNHCVNSARNALIDVLRSNDVAAVVEHEVAHLLRVSPATPYSDEDAQHCQKKACTMYPEELEDKMSVQFCGNCAERTARNAHQLRMLKYGHSAIYGRRIFEPW